MFTDEVRLDINLRCGMCQCVLRSAMQTMCGHRFCELCLNSHLNIEIITCPSCTRDFDVTSSVNRKSSYPDKAMRRELFRLVCKCRDCEWNGTLGKYEEAHEAECDNKSHNNSCPHCQMGIRKQEQEAHVKVCPERRVTCDFCGMKLIRFKDIPDHCHPSSGMCNNPRLPCKYGCKELLPVQCDSSFMNKHLNDDPCVHIEALAMRFDKLHVKHGIVELPDTARDNNVPISLLTRKTKMLQLTAKSIEEELSDLINTEEVTRKLIGASSQMDNDEKIFQTLGIEAERCLLHIKSVIRQDERKRHKIRSCATQIGSLEIGEMSCKESVSEHEDRVLLLEHRCDTGTFIWKIPHVSRKLAAAQKGDKPFLLSSPFTTSNKGYKMYANLYLDGEGDFKGTHVSLFVAIGKGYHDHILPWPFKQNITMKMLDVTNDAQHKKDVSITLSPRVDMAAYQKPVSDMNIAIGHGDFISLENFHRGKRYVTNDTLFIKIISITKPEVNNACEFA